MEIGKLDRVTSVIGERGMGKSTFLKMDSRQFQRETGGYVIGHSPNGQVGDAKDIRFYSRLDGFFGLSRGLQRHPEAMHFVTTGPVEPVLRFADSLSLQIRKKAHERVALERGQLFRRYRPDRPALKGTEAHPVLIVIDEGASMKRHPSNEEIEFLQQFLMSARHKHIALSWSIQGPSARSWLLMEQSNRIRAFRYTHEWGANGLRAAGIPKEVAFDLGTLPKYSYFELDKGSNQGRYRILPKPKPGY